MSLKTTNLATSDKNNWLARYICHRKCRTNLGTNVRYHCITAERQSRTLSSTVSHLVTSIPSIPRPLPEPDADEKSRRARSNLVSWSTASLPTRASPTKIILSGLLVATSCGGYQSLKRCFHHTSRITHLGECTHKRLVNFYLLGTWQ